MPHDFVGNIISVGNIVWIPCRVKLVHLSEDYCNLDLESIHSMPPYKDQPLRLQAINSQQVRKDCGNFPSAYPDGARE